MKNRIITMFRGYEPATKPLYLRYEPAAVYTKNNKVYKIWAGYGKYGKIYVKKWKFCEKLMFLNRLNGYLLIAFRLQYFAQVFTIDWMRIPPNIKFIHSPNLKLWINVLHGNFMDIFEKFLKIAKLQHKFWIWSWNFYKKS